MSPAATPRSPGRRRPAPPTRNARIVLRTSTERPEAVEAGYAKGMDFDKEATSPTDPTKYYELL